MSPRIINVAQAPLSEAKKTIVFSITLISHSWSSTRPISYLPAGVLAVLLRADGDVPFAYVTPILTGPKLSD